MFDLSEVFAPLPDDLQDMPRCDRCEEFMATWQNCDGCDARLCASCTKDHIGQWRVPECRVSKRALYGLER